MGFWRQVRRPARRDRRVLRRGKRRIGSHGFKRTLTRKVSIGMKKYHKKIYKRMKKVEEDAIVSEASREVYEEMECELKIELYQDGTGELREDLKAEIHREVVKHLAELKRTAPEDAESETRSDEDIER